MHQHADFNIQFYFFSDGRSAPSLIPMLGRIHISALPVTFSLIFETWMEELQNCR